MRASEQSTSEAETDTRMRPGGEAERTDNARVNESRCQSFLDTNGEEVSFVIFVLIICTFALFRIVMQIGLNIDTRCLRHHVCIHAARTEADLWRANCEHSPY